MSDDQAPWRRQSSQITETNSRSPPVGGQIGNGVAVNMAPTCPIPPPPPPPGALPNIRLNTEIPDKRREPPDVIQNAMMTKDKKPFTYTPGGIDLSQIRSPRMQKRIVRNANSEGVGQEHVAAAQAAQAAHAAQAAQSPPNAAPSPGVAPPQIAVPVLPAAGNIQLHHVRPSQNSEVSNSIPPPPPPPLPVNVTAPIPTPLPSLVQSPISPIQKPIDSLPKGPTPYVPPSTAGAAQKQIINEPTFQEILKEPEPILMYQPQTSPVPSQITQNITQPKFEVKPGSRSEVGSIYVPPITKNSQVGSIYIPPVTAGQSAPSPRPTFQQQSSVTSPQSPLPVLNKAPTPWMSKQNQQVNPQVPAWANKETDSPVQPAQPVTRVIPIQVEGRESPMQSTSKQQAAAPQYSISPTQQTSQQQTSAEPNTRIIPIHIEGTTKVVQSKQQQQQLQQQQTQMRQINQQQSVQQQQQQQQQYTQPPWRYPTSQPINNSGNFSPQPYQPPGSTTPIQSKSFRVLQRITDTDGQDQSDSEMQSPSGPVHSQYMQYPQQAQGIPVSQMRKMQISAEDRALMNRFKAQEGHSPTANASSPTGVYAPESGSQPYIPPSEQQAPEPKKYMGSSIPSRSFKILQAMTATPENCGPGQSDL